MKKILLIIIILIPSLVLISGIAYFLLHFVNRYGSPNYINSVCLTKSCGNEFNFAEFSQDRSHISITPGEKLIPGDTSTYQFKINITNSGNVDYKNISIIEIYPGFLNDEPYELLYPLFSIQKSNDSFFGHPLACASESMTGRPTVGSCYIGTVPKGKTFYYNVTVATSYFSFSENKTVNLTSKNFYVGFNLSDNPNLNY